MIVAENKIKKRKMRFIRQFRIYNLNMNYHGQSPWYPQATPSASSFRLAVSTGIARGIRRTKIEVSTIIHFLWPR